MKRRPAREWRVPEPDQWSQHPADIDALAEALMDDVQAQLQREDDTAQPYPPATPAPVSAPHPPGYSHLTGTVLGPGAGSEAAVKARLKQRQSEMGTRWRALSARPGAAPRMERRQAWALCWVMYDVDTNWRIQPLAPEPLHHVLGIYTTQGAPNSGPGPEITAAAERQIQTAGTRLAQRLGAEDIRIYAKPGGGWRLNYAAPVPQIDAPAEIQTLNRIAQGLQADQTPGTWRVIELEFWLEAVDFSAPGTPSPRQTSTRIPETP